MNKIVYIEDKKYRLKKDYKNAFSKEELDAKWTDYFEPYDYIVGDYAYDKLRLKAFCKKENVKFNDINTKDKIKNYLKEDCAYECKYFILEKENSKEMI